VVPCENTDVSKEYTGSVSRVKVCKIWNRIRYDRGHETQKEGFVEQGSY
jgi:hypothetical protein